MPRINVEDSFWKDDRYHLLVEKIGKIRAAGACLIAMKVAQGFWIQNKLVPQEIWDLHELPPSLLSVGLIELCPNGKTVADGRVMAPGIYVRGSEKQFAWLMSSKQNGRKGGLKKAEKTKTAKTNDSSDLVLATSSDGLANPDLLSPFSFLKEKKKRGKPDLSVLPLLASLWNENRGKLAEVVACSSSRRRAINSAWREHPDELFWVGVIRTIARNTFLNGEQPSKTNPNWKAGFDWMLKPDNVHKVLEGNYEQKAAQRDTMTINSFSDIEAIDQMHSGGHR